MVPDTLCKNESFDFCCIIQYSGKVIPLSLHIVLNQSQLWCLFCLKKLLVCWESVNWNTQVRGSSLLYNILALRPTKGGKTALVSARNWKFAQKIQKQQVPHNCKLIYWSPVTIIMGMLSSTLLMWRLFLSLMLMMMLAMLLMTMLLMMLPPTLQM